MSNTGNKKTVTKQPLSGTVVSNRMKDTVVVSIARYTKHPKYGKFLVRTKRIKAHDAGNTCLVGDKVIIKETRPISKDKNFIVISRVANDRVAADEIIEETANE